MKDGLPVDRRASELLKQALRVGKASGRVWMQREESLLGSEARTNMARSIAKHPGHVRTCKT